MNYLIFLIFTLYFLYLSSRFLINIPEEERKDIVRLCFQIETAHWFYVDFHRQEQPDLPPCGLKDFTNINILLLNLLCVNVWSIVTVCSDHTRCMKSDGQFCFACRFYPYKVQGLVTDLVTRLLTLWTLGQTNWQRRPERSDFISSPRMRLNEA